MKAIIQKVLSSSVTVDSQIVGSIGRGYNVLLGIAAEDTKEDADWIVQKLLKIRLFNNWNDNIVQSGDGQMLIISQFTLYGKLKGNKLDFHLAMKAPEAKVVYESILGDLTKAMPGKIHSGIFGAMMEVNILNDGPVTIEIDSKKRN